MFSWNSLAFSVLCLVAQSCPTLCNPMDYSLPGSFCPWGFSKQEYCGVGCHALLQEMFPTQGSDPGLLHCRRILHQLNYQASPLLSLQSTNVGNLISGSSASCTPSLYTWKFSVHVLLKPSLKDFERHVASMWNERNCMVVWTFFSIALL